jgi:menaquinone-dependent protoporphyrinogen oxidase
MTVLVVYASAYGSTKGIAKHIGEQLARAGHATEVQPVDEVVALDGFDAIVLGSAIHNMAWLPPASEFARAHAAELANRPTWLFSVSSVGETTSFFGPRASRLMRRMRKDKHVAPVRDAARPRGHRDFAGAIERTHWGLSGRLFLRVLGGSYGDHRDWDDVDAWADEIARELDQARAVPPPA